MLVSHPSSAAVVALLLSCSWSQAADAQAPAETATKPHATNAECARAYERGQEQHQSGHLVAARETLQVCVRDACPDFIRSDCLTWYGEVQDELPTLVFAARSNGRDLTNVQVSAAGRALTSSLDGQVVELDPGAYDLTFAGPELRSVTQRVVVARGEHNRLIAVELAPLRPPEPPGGAASAPRTDATERSLLVPGIFAGVGVLGLSGFAAFGGWGYADESRLAESCRNRCSRSDVSSVRTKYVLADVSLGVGVVGLALGTYFYFSSSSEPRQARTPRFDVSAGAGQVGMSYGGTF
jgi:hypothetical protein